MKFTPTPKQHKRELKHDLQEFGRKLRLLEHFSGHEQQPDSLLVKKKSNFVPPLPNDRHLRLRLENISNPHDENPTLNQKSNVTSSERTALKILEKDESIIIKQAHKGGATVIIDKSYYRDKMLEMLSDTETYVELDQNKDDLVMKKIKRLTRQYKHELTKKEIDYIQNFSRRTSNFYGLPKIHKSSTINNAIKEQISLLHTFFGKTHAIFSVNDDRLFNLL